jgi:hypothetical protein
MKSAICTLFEGHYHYGVAALINSLYNNGFYGEVYIGYCGGLPEWADKALPNERLDWSGGKSLEINGSIKIHFLPVATHFHFTNYKPYFMLDLWNGPAKRADNIFYFDPDIVNKCPWHFYEQWASFGVALIHEIVWNDMPANHPKRMQWKMVAKAAGYEPKNNMTSYINAGFVGVSKERIGFLKQWQFLIETAITKFNTDITKFNQSDSNTGILNIADQDLLNLTAMCTAEPLSEMGPEAMDFAGGGWIMSHATGTPKPWKKNYLIYSIKGRVPSLTDKLYWQNCGAPISLYKKHKINTKHLALSFASFIGRFYRRH